MFGLNARGGGEAASLCFDQCVSGGQSRHHSLSRVQEQERASKQIFTWWKKLCQPPAKNPPAGHQWRQPVILSWRNILATTCKINNSFLKWYELSTYNEDKVWQTEEPSGTICSTVCHHFQAIAVTSTTSTTGPPKVFVKSCFFRSGFTLPLPFCLLVFSHICQDTFFSSSLCC